MNRSASGAYPEHSWRGGEFYPYAVGVFYSPSQLGHHDWGGVHTFPEGISPKVNVIEFEIAYYSFAFLYVNHYTTVTPEKITLVNKHNFICIKIFIINTKIFSFRE